ncbi:MAG: hypothetical protein LBE05_01200 [Microbacterium sp.]|jgi:hypothetical protein|nr:hypothetical protein [Microbacterium sp.]
MGTINTYFGATDDATAAAAVDDGPVSFAPVLDAVEATVQAGTLMALLTGQTYEEATADQSWARLITAPDHESAWVVSLPPEFTEAVACASDEKLAEVVGPWSQTEEFWGGEDPAELLDMLREWRGLAQTTQQRGENMYCWMSL